jgi:hypothetical protein
MILELVFEPETDVDVIDVSQFLATKLAGL